MFSLEMRVVRPDSQLPVEKRGQRNILVKSSNEKHQEPRLQQHKPRQTFFRPQIE